MTAPSIKDALEYLEAAANWMQRYLDTYGELGDDATQANIDDWHDAVKHVRATLSPPDGERREAIARILERHDMRDYGWTDEQFEVWWTKDDRAASSREQQLGRADTLLASGLVQNEAGIRADEREKCAEIADLRYEPVATEIAAAIRSARDGGAET